MTSHENLSRQQEVVGPSNRSFGLTFTGVFVLVGLWPLAWGGGMRIWALALAAALLTATLVHPAALAPLNRLWLRFGLVLHKITTPLILGVIFFLVVLPIGLLMRLLGKRPLQLQFDRDAVSYWIRRNSAAETTSMRNQF